jgi:pyrimidine-specific ribonucleoside hydrolase
MKFWLFAFALALPLMAANRPVIIDTDAGADDLLAISFLLSRPDVTIEAITVVDGLAHVHSGAQSILRLLDLAGKTTIPVYGGENGTAPGGNPFPDAWRRTSDELPRQMLPETTRQPEAQPAAEFLAARLHQMSKPVSILATGPLTNLAAAFRVYPNGIHCVEDLVIMGGAIRVSGNLKDGGTIYGDNTLTEWNFFVDPGSAKKVLESGVRFRLIPLDATAKVPIDKAFAASFKNKAKTSVGKFASALIEDSRVLIEAKMFFAWDPLAAVAIVQPDVVRMSSLALEVQTSGKESGRSREMPGRPGNSRVALDADSALFQRVFMEAFSATPLIKSSSERQKSK